MEDSISYAVSKFCRLCLENNDTVHNNIFQESILENHNDKICLAKELSTLFQIKYEVNPYLPNQICTKCYKLALTLIDFRFDVLTCENVLQNWLITRQNKEINNNESMRPGLNGNPGEFILDNNAIVTEVDPQQYCQDSDDDFSLDSESEKDVEENDPSSNLNAQHNIKSFSSVGENSITKLPIENNSSLWGQVAVNTYLCQYCDMCFAKFEDCSEHESRHDAINPFQCSLCELATTTRANLINHIKALHPTSRPYICVLCNKGFSRRSDLKKHTIVHTGLRPFYCTVCEKSFSRNNNLTKHMRIHRSNKPHICQKCPRSFSTIDELSIHNKTHSTKKPFQCDRCPLGFSRKNKLDRHQKTHIHKDQLFLYNQGRTVDIPNQRTNFDGNATVEQLVVALHPYTTQANENTDSAVILNQSINTTKSLNKLPSKYSRKFTCEYCGKVFTRQGDLQAHYPIHMDSFFSCKICHIKFPRLERLQIHEQECHSTIQYSCNICPATFVKKENFDDHIKNHEIQTTNIPTVSQTEEHLVKEDALKNLEQTPKGIHSKNLFTEIPATMNLGFYSETQPEDRNYL